jgi:hypothetical protein
VEEGRGRRQLGFHPSPVSDVGITCYIQCEQRCFSFSKRFVPCVRLHFFKTCRYFVVEAGSLHNLVDILNLLVLLYRRTRIGI